MFNQHNLNRKCRSSIIDEMRERDGHEKLCGLSGGVPLAMSSVIDLSSFSVSLGGENIRRFRSYYVGIHTVQLFTHIWSTDALLCL